MGTTKLFNHKFPSHIEVAYRTNTDSPISDKVRFARIQAGLTQEALASLVGIDRSTLIRLEGGQVSGEHMSTDVLIKIAEICGLEKTFCCDGFHSFLINSAEQIIAYRQKYGLRQRELANLMDVAHTTVKRWENGRSKMSKENYLRFSELMESHSAPLDEYHQFAAASPAMIIRQFRKEQRLSQEKFAHRLGFARAYCTDVGAKS